jgi:hypothetical protein
MWSNHVQKVMTFVSVALCSYLDMIEYGNLNSIELSEHGQI